MRTSRLLAAAAFLAAGLSTVFCPAFAGPTRAAEPRPTATPAPDTAGLKFRAIGPAASGGRVTAVAGSDADPALYYVGGAGGGVFKSTDGGVSFTPAWNGPPFGAIGALAVAPSAPDVVWAGTGEANPRNDVSFGDGVWISRDGAKHWTHAGLTDTSQIAKILVDPHDPRRAIVAALGDPWKDSPARGVYRTVDGGKTWAHTLYVGPASGAADLAWNPHDPRTIFASIWQFRREPWIATSGGPADGLYRSRDGGVTWTKVQGHGFPTDTLGRIGVAVARATGGACTRSCSHTRDRFGVPTTAATPGARPLMTRGPNSARSTSAISPSIRRIAAGSSRSRCTSRSRKTAGRRGSIWFRRCTSTTTRSGGRPTGGA
jgi:hypothetical protein